MDWCYAIVNMDIWISKSQENSQCHKTFLPVPQIPHSQICFLVIWTQTDTTQYQYPHPLRSPMFLFDGVIMWYRKAKKYSVDIIGYHKEHFIIKKSWNRTGETHVLI